MTCRIAIALPTDLMRWPLSREPVISVERSCIKSSPPAGHLFFCPNSISFYVKKVYDCATANGMALAGQIIGKIGDQKLEEPSRNLRARPSVDEAVSCSLRYRVPIPRAVDCAVTRQVSMIPGATRFTLIPCGPTSDAIYLVKCASAALVIA
jgi:hypothetical protein